MTFTCLLPRTGRLALLVLGAAIACSSGAAVASAASLSVHVPTGVTKGAAYDIRITGTFAPSEVTGRAFLISLIQFDSSPCSASAQDENRTNKRLQFYFAPASDPSAVGISEDTSPFARTDSFTAATSGTRHVCAYLYPQPIGATDSTAPIATADQRYVIAEPRVCRAPFTFPGGYGKKFLYDAVTVLQRANISCNAALHIAAKARALSRLKIIFGPQFGGGGYGGPFRVGSFRCWLMNRGSDFINARCHRGRQSLRFYDHRQYWSEHDPAFPPPALTP